MAENLLRLKVDSQEYDAKIKRAAEGIQHFVKNVRESGSNLKESGILARAFLTELGKMETVANGGKQQLRELTNALTTLTATYRGLSEEEKSSGFGKELAKQIDLLTERAGVAQDAMMDVQQSIRNAASDTRGFDQVAGGMTILTSTMQTATGAAKLLGIELGDNVEVIAKLQAAMAVTSGLQQMQNMLQKQSALMQGINALQKEFNILAKANPYVLLATAVAAVAGAYLLWSKNGEQAKKMQQQLNAELENTRNQLSQIDKDTDFSVGIAQAAGKSWEAIHRLRLEAARTKLELADMNYDKLAASGVASAEQMKEAANVQKQAWDNVMKVLNEGTIREIQKRNGTGPFSKKGGKTEDTNYAADSIMAQEKEVQRLTDAWNRASGAMRDGILKDLDAAKAKLEAMKTGAYDAGMLGGVTVTGRKSVSNDKAFRTSATNFDNLNTWVNGIKEQLRNADLGTPLYESLTEKLKDATTMSTLLQEMMERGLGGADLTSVAEKLKGALLEGDIPDDKVQEFVEKLNEKIRENGGVELEYNPLTGEVSDKRESKGGKNNDKSVERLSKAISGLHSIMGGMEKMGVQIPSEVQNLIGIIEGVMMVIQGVQTIISVTQASVITANTIAIAALTAAVWANTAASVIPFANGGIVPHAANGYFVGGNHYSGDVTPIMANAGELVLNRAQQYNLASQLTGNGLESLNLSAEIRGEQIRLVLNNNGRRTGRGEYVQTNRRNG